MFFITIENVSYGTFAHLNSQYNRRSCCRFDLNVRCHQTYYTGTELQEIIRT